MTDLLKKMVVHFAREIKLHDNEDFARRMRAVFDSEMYFFREFGIQHVERPGPVLKGDTTHQ